MNKRTKLTQNLPELMQKWKQYRRGLKNIGKTDWYISSDYCFDNPNKLDVVTFTIFPKNKIKTIVQEINANLPCDIKEMKQISEKVTNFLKSKYFFSICIRVENLKYFFNEQKAKQEIENALRGVDRLSFDVLDIKERYKKLKYLHEYLKKKSHSVKLLSQLYFVAQFVSQIIEFLLIKENGRIPHWCSDRDHITSWGDGIIFDLVNMYTGEYIKNRIADFHICLPEGINKEGNFNFDPLIRVPDIITGIISSMKMTNRGLQLDKKKHYDLFEYVIINNPRIFLIGLSFDKQGKESGEIICFEKTQ